VVRTITTCGGRERAEYAAINDARRKKDILAGKDWRVSPPQSLRKLNCRKVVVTPLGEVRNAND